MSEENEQIGPRRRRSAPDNCGQTVHGAYDKQVRQRFTDERTSEGKALARVMKSLIADCGPDLNTAQCILLDRIREKLMILMKIGEYLDKQMDLVTEKGELLPVLNNNYLPYSNALNKDVAALYAYAGQKKPKRIPTIEELVGGHNHGN
jgi:hypothetical protein